MGWFWDDATPTPGTQLPASHRGLSSSASPPPGCPMHQSSGVKPSSARVFQSSAQKPSSQPPGASACPYTPPGETPSATGRSSPKSTISALNPLNYMPSNLSQTRESALQTIDLPTEREMSTIPRGGDGQDGNWAYPSPQQMYNAMVRKGHSDTPQDAVESMVAVHNFLNEGAWAEILEWERRFGRGLVHGWRESRFGEEGSHMGAMILADDKVHPDDQPKLLRFMGNADKMTPRAYMQQVMGWVYPSAYGGPPPFDRHDWYVERKGPGGAKEVRYVIDYYSAAPEETGEPVFFLDIRPALDGPTGAAERLIRWGRDVWWRASGGSARLRRELE